MAIDHEGKPSSVFAVATTIHCGGVLHCTSYSIRVERIGCLKLLRLTRAHHQKTTKELGLGLCPASNRTKRWDSCLKCSRSCGHVGHQELASICCTIPCHDC